MTDYLTLSEVFAIHTDQIERFGGSHGLRDSGMLESALLRPQMGYYEDIIQQAAALWESLAQNHPFIDGSKRTAFAVVYTFLRTNGFTINADPLEAYHFIIHLYEMNEFNFNHLEKWIRNNAIKNNYKLPFS